MIIIKILTSFLAPKRLIAFFIIGSILFGIYRFQKLEAPLNKGVQGIQTASGVMLSFGDQIHPQITNLRILPGESKSFYIWLESNTEQSLTNFGITLLYNPNTIQSINIEPTKWGEASPLVLGNDRSTTEFMGKDYQTLTLSVGSPCTPERCIKLTSRKTRIAKVTVTAQNTPLEKDEILIHSNSVVMGLNQTDNLFKPDIKVTTLTINKTFPQSNQLSIRARALGPNQNTTLMELQIRTAQGTYVPLHRFNISGKTYSEYSYTSARPLAPNILRFKFLSDAGASKDLEIDYIKIGDYIYQTEEQTTFSTGTWQNQTLGCSGGFSQSQVLHCNGYFEFFKSL